MAEPIIINIKKPVAVDFSGGKVTADSRDAQVGKPIRSNANGIVPGDYEILLVPSGTRVESGEVVVGKIKIEQPGVGLESHVSVRAHVSNANPNASSLEEQE